MPWAAASVKEMKKSAMKCSGVLVPRSCTTLQPEGGPGHDAVLRLQEIGWQLFEQHPVLLQLGAAPAHAEADRARYEPVTARLVRLVEKGQTMGEFDPDPPPAWLVSRR
ncbi:hypothetical protein ACWD00_33505 [Streptomyces viridiviolaceus]